MTGPSVPPPLTDAERPAAPPLAEAAGQILFRQFRSLLAGRRAVVALAIAGLPVLITALIRDPHPSILCDVITEAILPFLVPLTALSLGSGLLYDEAEEGTLTFVFTTPIPRPAILLGKWAAALLVGWAVVLLSLGGTLLASTADLGAVSPFVRASVRTVVLGYPAYLGIFALLGTLFRRGFIAGLVYAFGFELLPTLVPGIIRYVSMRFYMNSLVEPDAPDKTGFTAGFFDFVPADPTTALAVLLSVAVAALFLTLLVVRWKEFPTRNVQA